VYPGELLISREEFYSIFRGQCLLSAPSSAETDLFSCTHCPFAEKAGAGSVRAVWCFLRTQVWYRCSGNNVRIRLMHSLCLHHYHCNNGKKRFLSEPHFFKVLLNI
jgi:hypothetical protein